MLRNIAIVATLLLVLTAALSASTDTKPTCERFDTSGHSVAEVLFAHSEADRRMAGPLRQSAQLLRDAMDFLVTQEGQTDWNLCAYDGIVLIDPETSFRTNRQAKAQMRRGLMFTLDFSFPVYVNVKRFKDEVVLRWRGHRDKQLGYTALKLFHELQHTRGGDQAAAFAAEEAFAKRLVLKGLLTERDAAVVSAQIANHQRERGFNEALAITVHH